MERRRVDITSLSSLTLEELETLLVELKRCKQKSRDIEEDVCYVQRAIALRETDDTI